MIGPIMLGHVHQRLCEAKGNSLPFGGMAVIISGDFHQLPPVCPNTSLFQALVHRHVYEQGVPLPKGTKLISYTVDTPAYVGVTLFGNFRMHELEEQMRAAEDPVHAGIVNQFRDVNRSEFVTPDMVARIPVLCAADVLADPAWQFPVFVVTTNRERAAINHAQVQRFATVHNLPLIRWRLPLSGRTAEELSDEETEALFEAHPVELYQYFCVNAPCYLTDNIGSRLSLANGTRVFHHSLTFDHTGSARRQHSVGAAEEAIRNGVAGQVVTIDVAPLSVNVRVPFDEDVVAAWDRGLTMVPGSVVVPVMANDRAQEDVDLHGQWLGQRVSVTPHAVELGFACSVWKVQGRTMSKVVLVLNKRPQGPHFSYAGLFVAYSRVKRSADMRRLPSNADDLTYLLDLRPKVELQCWQAGFDASGVWSPERARAAGAAPPSALTSPRKHGGSNHKPIRVARAVDFNAPDAHQDAYLLGGPTVAELADMPAQPLDGLAPVEVPSLLKNIGNSCWLNTVLQSIAHTPRIVALVKRGAQLPAPGQRSAVLLRASQLPTGGEPSAERRAETLAHLPLVLRIIIDCLQTGARCDLGARAMLVLLGRLKPRFARNFEGIDSGRCRGGVDWSFRQEDVTECMTCLLDALSEQLQSGAELVEVRICLYSCRLVMFSDRTGACECHIMTAPSSFKLLLSPFPVVGCPYCAGHYDSYSHVQCMCYCDQGAGSVSVLACGNHCRGPVGRAPCPTNGAVGRGRPVPVRPLQGKCQFGVAFLRTFVLLTCTLLHLCAPRVVTTMA